MGVEEEAHMFEKVWRQEQRHVVLEKDCLLGWVMEEKKELRDYGRICKMKGEET